MTSSLYHCAIFDLNYHLMITIEASKNMNSSTTLSQIITIKCFSILFQLINQHHYSFAFVFHIFLFPNKIV